MNPQFETYLVPEFPSSIGVGGTNTYKTSFVGDRSDKL